MHLHGIYFRNVKVSNVFFFLLFAHSDGNIPAHVTEGSEATKPRVLFAFLSAWLTSTGPES